MGLFDFLKKNTDAGEAYVAIAAAISADDKAVIARMKDCVSNTKAYVQKNEERFEERGFEIEDLEDEEEEIRWLALVDILEENEYVCERDWKDELEDFVYFVGNLKSVKARALPLEKEWFDEEGNVVDWCKVLDEKWKDLGCCVAAIDIDSDSYVLFAYDVDKVDKLCELAEELDRTIDWAKNM